MNGSTERRRIILAVLACFVVFFMCTSAFAGSVEIGSIDNDRQDSPVVVLDPDVPGELDCGAQDYQEPEQGSINEEGDLEVDSLTNEYDSNEKAHIAEEILGIDDDFFSESDNIEGYVHNHDFDLDGQDIGKYKEALSLAVNGYIHSTIQNPSGGNDLPSSAPSDFTSNLYTTVNNYLDNGPIQNDYIPAVEQLSSEGFTLEAEVIEERTKNTKTFLNHDGTRTAIIDQEPIHFLDSDDNWQDIDLNLQPSLDGGYECWKNNLKTNFEAEQSTVSVDTDGESWFKWTPIEQRYIDRYGIVHSLSDAQSSTGKINGNTIRYENTFKSTTEEYFVLSSMLKHNMILSEFPQSALNGLYLSYVGKIEMAEGLTLYIDGQVVSGSMETQSEIEVRSSSGDALYTLPPPFAYENNDAFESVDGYYHIEIIDGYLFLSINIPISWLKDPARVYPIVIDPNLYVTMDLNKGGYTSHYHYQSKSTTRNTYYYYTSTTRRVGFRGYQYSTYEYYYAYRNWFKWDTSAIPDKYNIVQIDFHGKQWSNSYSTFNVNLREAPKKPDDYSSSSSQAKKKELFDSQVSGRVYNSSVSFPRATSYKNIDIYALGGTAKVDMQANLTNDEFYLTMHKTVEAYSSTGYGYFYINYPNRAQLYVTYDPCPLPPTPDTGGPYSIPEGTKGFTLDASATFVCGSSVLYSWDTNEDGIYDLVSTGPTFYWNKYFTDDMFTNLTLEVKDLTYNYVRNATTTFTVYNVNPQITTPPTPVSGYEGQTISFPKVEFNDPGTDHWTYFYDFDGDNKIDKSGSCVNQSGKHYVPSVSWYFCDDVKYVNLTIEDEDGGYSDRVEQVNLNPVYDGDLSTFTRPADPSRDYYYRYMTYYSYTYMYVRFRTSMTSYDYDYRGLMKFDTTPLPANFEPTNVTLRTYVYRATSPGKVGVNDLSSDPYIGSYQNAYKDAGETNILDKENYVYIDRSDEGRSVNMYLDPQDFIDEISNHKNWYGVALDRYDESDKDIYIRFRGGSYTYLTVSDGTKSYTLRCYTNTGTNRNGMHGYVYFRWWPARDQIWRTDTSSYIYVEDYDSSYSSHYSGRGFFKFGAPPVDISKLVDADLRVRAYIYGTPNNIKIGITDLDGDPETSKDQNLWDDITADNIYNDTEWAPTVDYEYYTVELKDSDYVDKMNAHNDWYGVGLKKNSGTSRYLRIFSSDYSTLQYRPILIVHHRVPYQVDVNIENVDPVLDLSQMVVKPDIVYEGDTVSVKGVSYTDNGDCDTHEYRLVVDLGSGRHPTVVKDWTPAEDGKLDFQFTVPDDDPDDTDSDLSKDKISLQLELRDDDYVPDLHYRAIQIELNHYEYYRYSWYKDWGIYQNLQPWEEYTATWNSYPRSYSKSTPEDTVKAHGKHYYYTPYSYHFDVWNITALAKKWLDGTEKNYGVRVQPVTPGKDPNRLYSSDTGTSSRRPILRFIQDEPLIPELVLQPGSTEGKDTYLRAYPYSNNNYGTSSYLTYTYDSSSSSNRYETNGLIKFDLSSVPPETEENGIDIGTFDITVNNVAPSINMSAYKISLMDGTEVDAVKEGENFVIQNIIVNDPALGQVTETFEYRVDFGNGTYSPWSSIIVVMPGEYKVVPNDCTSSGGSSNNVIPFRPSFGIRRYQQWYSSSQLGGTSGTITKVGFRPDSGNVPRAWQTSYSDLKVYLSHTTATTLSTTFANNYGSQRTLVYSGTLSLDHPANAPDWLEIPLQNFYLYDGRSNIVMEISYTSGTESGISPGTMDADSTSYLHRLYASSPTSTTGSRTTGYGLVTKFVFSSEEDPYGLIPSIRYLYPDDHPLSGTESDIQQIKIQVRDDDTGSSITTIEITVENVPPSINPGEILVNGNPLQPNVLLVFDSYSSYPTKDMVEAVEACMQRPVVKSSFGMTLTEMNKYDLCFWMMGGYAVRYGLSTADRNLITSYINGGGKLILQSTYWYNYYSWASAFYAQFGIMSYTYSRYMGSSTSVKIEGTGGDIGGDDEYILRGGHSEINGYYYYFSMARLNGGTAEFINPSYTSGRNNVMVHKDNPETGSIAMMWGFDLNQINAKEDQEALMADVLSYFGLEPVMKVEIDEGDDITLKNWDIIDPAEGEPTETLHFQVDWGNGQNGPLANTTIEGGINLPPPTGDYLQVPNTINPYYGGNTIPWGPSFPSKRYMQFYPNKQLGTSKAEINSISFYYNYMTPWSITYNDLKIFLSHKSTMGLSSVFANNYGFDRTLVLSKSTYSWSKTTSGAEWKTISLDSTFKYNGVDNIVMEVVYTGGSGGYLFFNRDSGGNSVYRLWSASPTGTSGSTSGYGLYTQFGVVPVTTPVKEYPWDAYMHRYRDDPTADDDTYLATINVYDDDKGHSTYDFYVEVNNVQPVIDPIYVMPQLTGFESGSPNIKLPPVPFDDPATQYDQLDQNEVWTYWFDLDGNGVMNNAPDAIGQVKQSDVIESGNASSGRTPNDLFATLNDDYINQPIACYIFDDDMEHTLSDNPSGTKSTVTVRNTVPTASIEAYIPMEVRVRMSGTKENDLKVQVVQTNPKDLKDVLTDELVIERMPGQPKENPFSDGSPSAPLPVKVQPWRTIELVVTFDGTPDSNDVFTTSGPNGADPVYVYLDFPKEDDYDPADDTQSSSQGHHWTGEYKFNIQQDNPVASQTTDITSLVKDKKGYLVGTSYDDASDDAQFNWNILSGSAQLPYTSITYYNDGTDPIVGGRFRDPLPSPWTGTSPVTYMDMHEFTFAGGFSVALYVIDDDGGRSPTVTLTVQ